MDDNACLFGLRLVVGQNVVTSMESRGDINIESEVESEVDILDSAHVSFKFAVSNFLLDPLKFRFRKVVRIRGLGFLFISKFNVRKFKVRKFGNISRSEMLPINFQSKGDRYIVTTASNTFLDPLKCEKGLVIARPDSMICSALHYFLQKASNEMKQFVDKA